MKLVIGGLIGQPVRLLQVPSAISAQGSNFLLNPAHPDAARIGVAEVIQAPFDPRLV
ncbi:RES family NAD+ phosphorylase [Bradyrhizobium japonicum]|uniref:RES family NAD+ phosphorylase n=1 Tax=Bradyrhizobium japonicum TaxID=375 RepID=UPI002011C977|nr:RES family NAD+ phosphorylase [Bradyrhizobium japonicum]